MIRKGMPSDLIRGWVPVFPRDKREAFARRSCSNKKIERDDMRSTIRALIVANEYLESEACELMAAVSHAYVRGRFRTYSG